MDIGISSSCFFPDKTEKAVEKVGILGAKSTEVFFNCIEEMKNPILSEIKKIIDYYGISVRSIHPYTSFAEPFTLFGEYSRRAEEGMDFYKNYFETAQKLGAKAVVIHGGIVTKPEDEQRYFEVYNRLCETAKPYGVYPAHENVHKKAGSNIYFLERLKNSVGESFKTVLDIKQCRRCGVDEFDFINRFKESIVQVHISDCSDTLDCIPPGEGKYDFKALFCALNNAGYNESAVIELYNWGYKDENQIKIARKSLENL